MPALPGFEALLLGFKCGSLCGFPQIPFLRTRGLRVWEEMLPGEGSQPERAELKRASWGWALSQTGPTWHRQPGDHVGSAEHMCTICPRSLGLPSHSREQAPHLPGLCWSPPPQLVASPGCSSPGAPQGVTSCFSRCAAHLCRGCCVCLPAHPGNQTCT